MGTFNERLIKSTRKIHWCYGCEGKIEKGSSTLNYFGIGDDGGWSLHFCPDCLKLKEIKGDDWWRKEYNECVWNYHSSMELQEQPEHPQHAVLMEKRDAKRSFEPRL